jgi:hypothetical protein
MKSQIEWLHLGQFSTNAKTVWRTWMIEKGLANTFPCGFHYFWKGPIVAWCKGLSKDCTKNCPLEKGLANTFPCGFHYFILKKGPILAWCKGLSKNCTKNCPLEKGLASTCPCGFHYKKKGTNCSLMQRTI